MKITKLELRNKKSGFTIKPCEFDRVNIFRAEDINDAVAVFESIIMLRDFALGLKQDNNLDNISRVYFYANHHEYLWFAKTTEQDGQMLVDEEEIYNADNEIIATRGFAKATIRDVEMPEINVKRSLVDIFGFAEVADIQKGMANIYELKADSLAQIAAEIDKLPHGALVLLDGRALTECVDLNALRTDVQILAMGDFTGGVEKTITRKKQCLSIK